MLRYWNGSTWTNERAQPAPHSPHKVQPTPVSPLPYAVPHPDLKSVGTAYVLLFFFGGLGAHHFYLRNPGRGAFMLIVWAIGILALVSNPADPPLLFGIALVSLGVLVLIDVITLHRVVAEHNRTLA